VTRIFGQVSDHFYKIISLVDPKLKITHKIAREMLFQGMIFINDSPRSMLTT
jgi:hypothetical protein